MIELSNISKSYGKGKVKAVDSLSLTIERGQIFGFIGPNGAGKTTTIKIITGILTPDSGVAKVNGIDIATNPITAKSTIGYVPDSHDIYENVTGYEYLNFLADIYGVSEGLRQERAEKYLSMFSLSDAAGDLIKTYSHGMKQKLLITGALLHNPSLWILDEPLLGLDPTSAHLLKEEMKLHAAAGNTVFFSTHVLEVAERLCTSVAIIDKGRIVALGAPDELQSARDDTLESVFLRLTEEGRS